jgi:hypothetical protein
LQVHEARSALGEAVHTMRLELAARREECEALRIENQGLRDNVETLGAEVAWQREERARLIAETEHVGRMDQELAEARSLIATFQNMKAVRWSAWPRRLRDRWRRRAE